MPLVPGTRLGPYEIRAPIGVGGMGEVYKARDTRLDRIIALQSQTSGLLNAQSTSLSLLLQESSLALDALKGELGDGAKLAREVGRELGDLTRRIDVCRREAERRYPVEYHAAKEHVLTSETRDDED